MTAALVALSATVFFGALWGECLSRAEQRNQLSLTPLTPLPKCLAVPSAWRRSKWR
jgi:hypothetical protein